MQNALKKIFRLLFGFFLYGLGIALTMRANLGLDPWGVFHQGLSKQTGITMGVAIQIVGAVIMVFDLLLNERIGWGTLGNVYFIGLFLDIIQRLDTLPAVENIPLRFLMMIGGMIMISLATFLYLGARLGSGPRDGLMVALTKRLKLPVGVIRSAIELTALVIGYLMGGQVGWGTLVMSLAIGVFIQTTFTIFKFDVHKVVHRYIDSDIAYLKERFAAKHDGE